MTVSSPIEPNETRNPMSVGDILKTGWRLYASNFSQFLKIAIIATVWAQIPTLLNLITTFLPVYLLGEPLSPGVAILLFIVSVAIAIYCTAQSLGQFAGISRIAYQSLSNGSVSLPGVSLPGVSLPGASLAGETPESSLQFTRSRKFSFLGATILQSVILVLTLLGLLIVSAIFFAIVGSIAGAIAGEAGLNPMVGLLFLLIFLGWLVAFIGTYLYVAVRFMFFEQSLAIEPNTDAFDSLSRSWEITKHGVLKSMIVTFLLSLITVVIVSIPVGIMSVRMPTDLIAILSEETPDPELLLQALLPFYTVLFMASIAISLFLVPWFKTTFTVLYFDLRDRLERRAFRETVLSERAE
jgi:hypothetical protein